MDLTQSMKKAIDYIEENLAGEIDYGEIARVALCSQHHFQRMFVFIAGIPLSEYIRRRRLTLAAFDLQNTNDKIIEIALRYGYQSPDAFSRAFQGLHHIMPSKAREKGVSLKAYPRITITFHLKGLSELNYRIEEKEPFTILGVKKRLSYLNNLGKEVGGMWSGLSPQTVTQLGALGENLIGAYWEMYDDSTTDYYIGIISDKQCPENLTCLKVAAGAWAVFEITGSLNGAVNAMAEVWGRIFSEWFPTTDYEHATAPEIEWYSKGDMADNNYYSEIWIPIIKNHN